MITRFIRYSLLTSLITVLIAPSSAAAASQPQKALTDRVQIPIRLAPVYSFPIVGDVSFESSPEIQPSVVLNSHASRSNPNTIGYTTYDYQHNCSMGRQAEHRGTDYLHFGWMAQAHDTLGANRGIGYQAYGLLDCDYIFVEGGLRIEGGYAGYVTIDADPGGWALPVAHEIDDDIFFAGAYWDFKPGGPAFGVFTRDHPYDIFGWYQNSGTGPGNENIWPKSEWHLGTENVLHMVTTERGWDAGDPQTFSYFRRIGPYGTGEGLWTDQRLVDTAMNINVTIASSPVSDKVAIVWNAPVDYKRDGPDEFSNQYENDVWYALSTNQGADWAHDTVSTNLGASSIGHMVDLGIYEGGNITQFPPLSSYKAYCDISALITTLDELNIVWGCRRWTDTTSLYRRQSAIFHWAENSPTIIRRVVAAEWDTGGPCYGHAWGSDAAKMSISECDGKLYVLYTQFGKSGNSCENVDADNHVVNGRLYMSVYHSIYDAWDRAQEVTELAYPEEECIPGDMNGPGTCNSEYWASMARYGRVDTCQDGIQHVLDILYINDYAPGGCVQTESGVWTVNPVMWLATPCREPVIAPILDYYPWAVGICYNRPIFIVPPSADTSFNVILENFGLADVNYTAMVEIDSCSSPTGGNNTAMEISPTAGVVPRAGGIVYLEVAITTLDEEMDVTVYAHVTVNHDAEGYPPIIIPICITVPYIDWPWFNNFTLETTCKKLRIYNMGELSNNGDNASMDYVDFIDPDDCADLYLYDGSPIVCRDIVGDEQCFFTVFDNNYASDHALRQLTNVMVDSISNDSFTTVSVEFLTADSAIQFRVDYYVPKLPEDCEFIIQRLKYWNCGEVILPQVAVGEVLDWDIPSYAHPSNNESGFDAVRNLIYQYACGNDPCDSEVPGNRFGGIASYLHTPYKNYMTIENDIFVYMTGPFGLEAPLPSDTMYGLMTGVDGFATAALDSCEDLSTLVTFGVYDLLPGDTMCSMVILATSRRDPGGLALREAIDRANDFIEAHTDVQCNIPHCYCTPGDANWDNNVDVGDAVYIINYVFKEGPPPIPFEVCSGDANADCDSNVGDAVFIINYVFKYGPPPPDCWEWKSICGPPVKK